MDSVSSPFTVFVPLFCDSYTDYPQFTTSPSVKYCEKLITMGPRQKKKMTQWVSLLCLSFLLCSLGDTYTDYLQFPTSYVKYCEKLITMGPHQTKKMTSSKKHIVHCYSAQNRTENTNKLCIKSCQIFMIIIENSMQKIGLTVTKEKLTKLFLQIPDLSF